MCWFSSLRSRHMSVMVAQITGNSTVCTTYVHINFLISLRWYDMHIIVARIIDNLTDCSTRCSSWQYAYSSCLGSITSLWLLFNQLFYILIKLFQSKVDTDTLWNIFVFVNFGTGKRYSNRKETSCLPLLNAGFGLLFNQLFCIFIKLCQSRVDIDTLWIKYIWIDKLHSKWFWMLCFKPILFQIQNRRLFSTWYFWTPTQPPPLPPSPCCFRCIKPE